VLNTPRTDVRGIPHHSTYEEDRAMNLVRFIGLLFVFIGVLVSCAVAVVLLVLMLRLWPLLLIIVLACAVFGRLLNKQN
jgi:hypothetical protein